MGADNKVMENQRIREIRRERLKHWIEANCESVTQFAASIRKEQSQIADMLRGAKSFGEKVARDIEERAGMPPGYLSRTEPIEDVLFTRLLAVWHALKSNEERHDLVRYGQFKLAAEHPTRRAKDRRGKTSQAALRIPERYGS